MNRQPPAFIVQSLDQARAALTVARAFSCTPLILSTRGYAAVMGAAVFQALITTLRQEFPDSPFTSALDCGTEPGYALAAFRAGVEGVVIGGNREARARIKDMAAQSDCMVYSPTIYDAKVLNMDSGEDMTGTDMMAACYSFLGDRLEGNGT